MKNAMKKTLLASLVLPVTLIGAQSASAAEITEWGYSVDNSFTNVTATDGAGGVTQTDEDGTDTLTWGTDSQSSISINDVSNPPSLFTNGDAVPGGTFTHDNQVIAADDASLNSFNLNSALTLMQLTPEGDANEALDPLTFDSFFSETLNNGDCVAGSQSSCDDIFTVSNIDELGGELEDGGYRITAPSFTIDDYSYTVFLQLNGLNALNSDACAQAGAADGCVGLLTQEGAENNFSTSFSITSQQVEVPEPGSLALLGLGLAGLGVAGRKARK